MSLQLAPSRAARVVGVLFSATGIAMLIAAGLAPASGALYSPTSLGGVLVASIFTVGLPAIVVHSSGIGLLKNQVWGWVLGVLIALSGLLIVTLRLVADDGAGWQSLSPALLTDFVVAILLFVGRPRSMPREGAE